MQGMWLTDMEIKSILSQIRIFLDGSLKTQMIHWIIKKDVDDFKFSLIFIKHDEYDD